MRAAETAAAVMGMRVVVPVGVQVVVERRDGSAKSRRRAQCHRLAGWARMPRIYVACSDSGIEGEAGGVCGMECCERGLQAAPLGEAGSAAVQSEVVMVGAEGVGSEEERLDRGGRE